MAFIRIGEKGWTLNGDKWTFADGLRQGVPIVQEVEGAVETLVLITPSLAWAEFSDEPPDSFAEAV